MKLYVWDGVFTVMFALAESLEQARTLLVKTACGQVPNACGICMSCKDLAAEPEVYDGAQPFSRVVQVDG